MADIVTSFRLAKLLKEEGYELPDGCRDVRLDIEPDGPVMLVLTCFIKSGDMVKIGKALSRLGELP